MSAPLSPHFSAHEFVCHCGCGTLNVDTRLVDALEELRVDVGNQPVTILSACRCPTHNTEVGGAPRSEHLTTGLRACTAADVRVPGVKLSALYFAACKVGAFHGGGIGVYPDQDFLHVDVRGTRARWGQIGRVKVEFIKAWDRLLALEMQRAGTLPA